LFRLLRGFLLISAFCLVFLPLAAAAECSAGNDVFIQYDLNIPGVTQQMLSPDFWIKLADRPDELIMTAAEIEKYNRRNLRE